MSLWQKVIIKSEFIRCFFYLRTWLDLINAIKTHLKKAFVSQAIKHKLIKTPINNLIRRTKNPRINTKSEENEKNTLLKLFGTRLIETKSFLAAVPNEDPSTASNVVTILSYKELSSDKDDIK